MNNPLSGREILVVEDEMLVLLMIEDMLVDLGCESVTAAATVDRALAALDAQSFDAAMLDMNLNGDHTYEVADALAAKDIPFLFATGYSGLDIQENYRDRPILKKPFSDDTLGQMLSDLLQDAKV